MMESETKLNQLPKGWVRTKVGEIFEFAYGKGLVKKDRKENGPFPVYGSSGIVGFHDEYVATGPKVIVGRKGAAGAVHYCNDNCWPIDTTYFINNINVVDSKFSYYLLKSLRLNQFETSTAIPGLNRNDAYRLDISLPPLPEQKRIVAKIEELFSELDNGIAALKTAREQLKVYRQAILKHAFEGKLTTKLREENAGKLETQEQLLSHIQKERQTKLQELVNNGDNEAKRYLKKLAQVKVNHPEKKLPLNAKWVSLIEICNFIVDCHNKTAPYENKGIWLIRTPCVKDGKILLNEEARFISEETYEYWTKRCPPKPGDIIFTREAPMGEVGIVPENSKICMGQRMMLLRPSSHLASKYLLYSMMEPGFQSRMNSSAVGTGVKHLRVGDVEKLCIPLFSQAEQSAIIDILDEQLSVIEEQEKEIEESLKKSEILRQSILTKALAGQLVLQDSSDEPASKLLERAKVRKAVQSSSKTINKKQVNQG
ncbi:Type-1 restriction enzyme EcoKI specificity protein [Legionella gratiana]|uniref:Type I restriction enzyme EcoKI specificity protein n=1 Tax=Legionella gratiana TaxID=45066 RepID=A0A378J5Q9_9GAMM|nr:restriction endonuclease subunit S [Legionella gratiana]KTD05856.1 Type-1 restriction enzyme EcoKI specificity protein [Legionella gratiana]STX42257.1 Type I restriction enzyme EcoKI specificity protein [Legionella gratiana]